MYSHLDKDQLRSLTERLERQLKILETIRIFEENNPLIAIEVSENNEKNTISVKSIGGRKRPPTSLGSQKQGAHIFAYSAILKSIVNYFNDLSLKKINSLLPQFHQDLYVAYVTSITSNPYKYEGRRVIFGKLDLHQLKLFSDEIYSELMSCKQTCEACELIKLYITAFLFMHNRLVDAVVNQLSKYNGESYALKKLEDLERLPASKEYALKPLSTLIDQDAVKAALNDKNRYNPISLIGFQILGIYKLVNSFPNLSKSLPFENLFSPNSGGNGDAVSYLARIIFSPQSKNISDEQKKLIEDSLGLLKDLYRVQNISGRIAEA